MTRQQTDIDALAEEFFEWHGPRTNIVTLVSAKLFAKHYAEAVNLGRALKSAPKILGWYDPTTREVFKDVNSGGESSRGAVLWPLVKMPPGDRS